jgi:subtilisin family serine protease
MRTTRLEFVLVACAAALSTTALSAQDLPDVSQLAIPGGPLTTSDNPAAFALGTEIDVVVGLAAAPLAVAHGRNAKQRGGQLSAGQQRQYQQTLEQQQNAVAAQIRLLGGREVARLSKASNALIVRIDASRVGALRAMPGVRTVRPVRNYELDLTETVPYVGGSAVHSTGFDGTGKRVAVLDSGIDYTHASFGGPGTAAAYTAAYGTSTGDARNTTTDGLFPTGKVIGGFDFVGEVWPAITPPATAPALAPDPDPIDCGPSAIAPPCDGGHGSHVADIIAGARGVAPGAKLYAVKVCSAVATSCSGVALLQAMEFALDPNGDGDIGDAVDVINLSLGSSYGQIEDDLTQAVTVASQLGVVVVAAAGNDADRPYIVSSPSISPAAISVAQTQVPSAVQNRLTIVAPPAIARDYPAVFQPWSTPPAAAIQAPVQYGNGAGANLNGCAAFPAGSLAGKIVLVDRGVCTFTDKVRSVANGGGLVALIGLVAAGDPFEGAFGGGPPITIPGYMIHQATANAIKSQLAAGAIGRLDPNNFVPLVGSMVSGSARGPSHSSNSIKPEIAAPGASRSAEAGTGTTSTAFGGTSGATPMVSGAAALLLQAHPAYTPLDVKARLVTSAETNVLIDPAAQPGVLAPITRIGGGELRINRAFASSTAAWDAADQTPALSFGYAALTGAKTFQKNVVVRNYGSSTRTYSITPSFRYANDSASGAVLIDVPSSVTVPAGGTGTFRVRLKADATRLPIWTLNGGSRGGDGFRLQGVELDGYLTLSDGRDTVRLPWHILPHRAAEVTPASTRVALSGGAGSVALNHTAGTIDGRVDVFALLGTSGRIPPPTLPGPGDNFAVVDLKFVGARLVSLGGPFGIQFAVNTFGARSHPNYPAEFDIYVDSNRDGTDDYVVFNLENGGFGATGQNVVAVANLATNAASVFFFTDADLDSGNAILTAPLSALGLSPNSTFDFSVYAFDNYFTGNLTDAVEGITFTPATPRFAASGVPATGVPVGGSSTLAIQEVSGGAAASPSQSGVLLLYRDARTQREADGIVVK